LTVGRQVHLEQGNIRLTSAALDARRLTQTLARYRAPNPTRSIVELVITAGPLVVLWLLMWVALDLGCSRCPPRDFWYACS
jgi:hypothetical protein